MSSELKGIFLNESLVKLIQRKLPEIFNIAEIECSRAGKVGMEVGSVRESILISLLMYVFGENNIKCDIPITESEIDVILFDTPISIKTKTGQGFNGIKAVWTVDPRKVHEYIEHFKPHFDILLAQLVWNQSGGLYYIPVEAQLEVFNRIGVSRYLIPPKEGTNPRGVEYSSDALFLAIRDPRSKAIPILWKKPDITYSKYKRWLDMWKEN